MNRRGWRRCLQRLVIPVVWAAQVLAAGLLPAAATARPNIVLLLADDLGYRDLGCFGSTAVETPHLDRLAAEGLKLTDFYAASAVCTPTRASILTGRYPLRFDIRQHFRDIDRFLPTSATTIAELLRDAGYATAHVGKWHLGGLHVDPAGRRSTDQPGPRQHGFEHFQTQIEQQPLRGRMGADRTLFRQGGTVLLRDGERVGPEDPASAKHLTDANGDFCVELIERFAASGQPFFLNCWWLVPHKPYEPAPEPHWSATAAPGITDDQHRFRSMVRHMDANVGKILAALDRSGITENTLVLFTSDNGAAFEGDVGTLKGGKTDLHDGGLRVPLIARWPGRVPAGRQSDAFGHTNDLLPTCCAAAGVPLPDDLPGDGLNLLPHLTGSPPPAWQQRGAVYWQLDLYKRMQRHEPKPKPYATEVARLGRWKLLARDGEPVELFDIEADPDEARNLLKVFPERAAEMASGLRAWLREERIEP